jgi:hypothetical protein
MSISAVSSSSLAQIETTLLAELTGASSTSSAASTASTASETSTTSATTQLTKDLASLLKDLASGNVDESKSAITKVQQDLKTQIASDATTNSTTSGSSLDNLLSQIAGSLNSTNSTAGSLQDLATHLIQNGQGSGSVVNTTA